MKYKVSENEVGERIDKFLSKQAGLVSRSQVQKLIKKGLILVNGKVISASYSVKLDDVIKIEKEKIKNETIKKDKEFSEIEIIEDNNDYLVINKPANLAVHGLQSAQQKDKRTGVSLKIPSKEETLVDFLLQKYPEIKKVGESEYRPGIVHRLDKEVSGLMVIAKNNEMFNYLKQQFKDKKVYKKYVALVFGAIELPEETDKINFPIKRSERKYRMAAVPKRDQDRYEKAKSALTIIDIRKSFINYTLLNVEIKTGRTHQIRVHMHAYSHPIVGDMLYSTKKTREKNIKIKEMLTNRIFLYARRLSFKNKQGEIVNYEIEMPEELKEFLKTVK